MIVAYMALHLLPTAAVLTLAWFVVRAVSVRVVWRDTVARRSTTSPPETADDRGRGGVARPYTVLRDRHASRGPGSA